MEAVTAKWLELQRDYPDTLTSFLRLTSIHKDSESNDYPVYASGLFHGSIDDLINLMQPLEIAVPTFKSEYEVKHTEDITEDDMKGINDLLKQFQPFNTKKTKVNKTNTFLDLLNYDVFQDDTTPSTNAKCLVKPPRSNCGAPHPHKVSSAFSKTTFKKGNKSKEENKKYYQRLAKKIAAYMENNVASSYVRSYMTFHSMGGAITTEPEGGRAFAYGDREFLLQFQSWWNYPKDNSTCQKDKTWQQPYINWVKNFRKYLESDVEGAFINFVDKELVPNPSTPQGKYELLKYYYAQNLDDLIKIKQKYDPNNLFNFEMSIPTKKPSE